MHDSILSDDSSTEERLFPPVDASALDLAAPIVEVTLLEDRAQVTRRGRVHLEAGQHRLAVRDVAPILQDVSLRAEVRQGAARVADARARRAMRVRREHRPEAVRALEAAIEEEAKRFDEHSEDRRRAEDRQRVVLEMLAKGAEELPDDAAWGIVNRQVWHDTFESLFKRSRELQADALEHYFGQRDAVDELSRLAAERQAQDRADSRFIAWLEIDVSVVEAGEVELSIEYVVPNALWRPLHSARLLDDGRLEMTSSAAVWQNTGEDWGNCQLLFSTARSSLGTEPPLLRDDLLAAQRRADEVVVAARQVKVQRAGLGAAAAGGAAPGSVDLPGVDDGGEVRCLRAEGPATVPSTGRPSILPLFSFVSEADIKRVSLPELDEKVFLKAIGQNRATAPLLAGPVELVQGSGAVGWTRLFFVAPGERFELGFGPDDAFRVTRKVQQESEPDPVGKWTVTVTLVTLFVSNLAGEDAVVEVTERIPVSETEHVKIALLEDGTSPAPVVDENGFCTWRLELPGNGHKRVKLAWRQATAPGVRGL